MLFVETCAPVPCNGTHACSPPRFVGAGPLIRFLISLWILYLRSTEPDASAKKILLTTFCPQVYQLAHRLPVTLVTSGRDLYHSKPETVIHGVDHAGF